MPPFFIRKRTRHLFGCLKGVLVIKEIDHHAQAYIVDSVAAHIALHRAG